MNSFIDFHFKKKPNIYIDKVIYAININVYMMLAFGTLDDVYWLKSSRELTVFMI